MICTSSSAHWQQVSKLSALRRFELILKDWDRCTYQYNNDNNSLLCLLTSSLLDFINLEKSSFLIFYELSFQFQDSSSTVNIINISFRTVLQRDVRSCDVNTFRRDISTSWYDYTFVVSIIIYFCMFYFPNPAPNSKVISNSRTQNVHFIFCKVSKLLLIHLVMSFVLVTCTLMKIRTWTSPSPTHYSNGHRARSHACAHACMCLCVCKRYALYLVHMPLSKLKSIWIKISVCLVFVCVCITNFVSHLDLGWRQSTFCNLWMKICAWPIRERERAIFIQIVSS